MRLETAVIVTKGFVVTGAAFTLSLAGSLSQWSNTNDDISLVQWIIIAATSLGAGLTALGGFLSSAFGKYMTARSENGNGTAKSNETSTKSQG